jgi:hypothetical protein
MHTFMGLSIVLSIKPTNGPIEGGTEVTVLGYNFIYATDLLCQFGSIDVPALFVSSSEVRCVSPKRSNHAMDGTTVQLSLYSESQQSTNNNRNTIDSNSSTHSNDIFFDYAVMPNANHISPSYGDTSKSNTASVMINGSGFVQNSTKCKIRGNTAVLYDSDNINEINGNKKDDSTTNSYYGIVLSPTTMMCLLPANPTNIQLQPQVNLFTMKSSHDSTELLVSNNNQDYSSTSLYLKHGPQAMIVDVRPRSGPTSGGTEILIIGLDMLNSPSLSCKFIKDDMKNSTTATTAATTSTKIVPSRWISATSSMCITPTGFTEGDVRVTLSNNAQSFTQLLDIVFHFYTPIEIQKIEPIGSPMDGKRAVRIIGNRFDGAELLACRFNLTTLVPATYINRNEIILSK